MISAIDVHALACTLAGTSSGAGEHCSPRVRKIVLHLEGLPVAERDRAWTEAAPFIEDHDAISEAVLLADPSAPPPVAIDRPANLADVRAASRGLAWLWPAFVPAARVVGIAGSEGTGKTRFALDLARRVWHGEGWPDGQAASVPAQSPTLWICSDGQQDEIADTAASMNLPDGSVLFNTSPAEPYDGNNIDDPDDLERLEKFIEMVKPWAVIVDSLTFATSRELCRANEAKAALAPLRDLAQRTGTTIILLLHVNKEGVALGRRVRGLTRTLLQLECPDPDQSGRLRLWVDKSSAKKPNALGVTMRDGRNDYDGNPPGRAEPSHRGRPPKAKENVAKFIRGKMAGGSGLIGNDLANEVEAAGIASIKTFWRVVDDMEADGEIVRDGGPGTRRQTLLRLVQSDEGRRDEDE